MAERLDRRNFAKIMALSAASLAVGGKEFGNSDESEVLDIIPERFAQDATWPIRGELSEIAGDGINPGLGYTHLMPTVNTDYTPDGGHHIGTDFNRGDYDEDCGEPIKLIANGVCIHTSKSQARNLGNIAIFCHKMINGDLVYSRFAHLQDYFVEPGKEYAKGQTIASMGKSGWLNGNCHLHLDVATRLTFDMHYTGIWQDARWYPHRASVEMISQYFLDPVALIQELIDNAEAKYMYVKKGLLTP
jgi:murein DD-endopeptidase MepM/ murein hydrolase activator NlpD